MADHPRVPPTGNHYGRILGEVEHAVIATDLDGRITYWNSVAEQLYGWSGAEAIGKPIIELMCPPGYGELAEAIMEKLRKGESWGGPSMVRRSDGSELQVFVIDAPVWRNGQLVGIVGVSIPWPALENVEGDTLGSLTRREMEVLRLTAQGKARGEVAKALGISARTVESHRQNIYNKLGLRSRTDLILFAVRYGLIVLDQQASP